MLAIAESLIPDLRKQHILEVGPAFGYFAAACRKRGLKYSGIEMNEAQAERLRAKGFDVGCSCIPPFPPDGKDIHLIWISHVLEHAQSPLEAREMVLAAFNRLPPNGYLVVISPDFLSWKMNFWDADWSHGYPTTLQRVSQLFTEAGFRLLGEFHFKVHHVRIFSVVSNSSTNAYR